MADKKRVRGLKKWLKENNRTEDEMQKYWDELIGENKIVTMLHNSGVNWDQTNLTLIGQLPTEKERTAQRKEQEAHRKELEEKAKKEADEKKKQYEENFESIIVEKIDNKEKLTESELKRVAYDYEISKEYGENRRWSRTVYTVCRLKDRCFMVEWEEDLTECQENSFFTQPYEVELHEYEKVIIVKEWVRKEVKEDKPFRVRGKAVDKVEQTDGLAEQVENTDKQSGKIITLVDNEENSDGVIDKMIDIMVEQFLTDTDKK